MKEEKTKSPNYLSTSTYFSLPFNLREIASIWSFLQGGYCIAGEKKTQNHLKTHTLQVNKYTSHECV
jgi:hypothetical protein